MLTWLEIDQSAIRYNLKQFRKLAGKNILLMPVIKANAYGHGFLGIAKICETSKEADRICVVNMDEALELIKNKIKKSIMILSFFEPDANKIQLAGRNNVIFPLYAEKTARILNAIGERLGKKIKVHLKIDTGATRIGILPSEAPNFVARIKTMKYLDIEGIWSHFASSEDDPAFTKKQYDIFRNICAIIEKQGTAIPVRHIACSAATISYKYTHENASRLGLGLYGLYSDQNIRNKIALKPALSWHTTIIQIKNVPTGTGIGYGSTYKTNRPSKIAVIPVGYWDGYDRRLSNKAYVLVKGSRCQIIGRICMNLCMIDITNMDVKEGDKATLIGKNGTEYLGVDDLAGWCGTINYEFVDRINPLLPRVFK